MTPPPTNPPPVPWSWFHVGRLPAASPGPWRVDVAGRRLAIFRGADGALSAVDARCVHMGADLSTGTVVDGTLRCPLHGWAFGPDGRCDRITSVAAVPPFARQATFLVAVVGGHAFVANRNPPQFPLPFFDGVAPADLRPARPFDLHVAAPWHVVGSNGFDVQHFRSAHDRTLVEDPVVDQPHPFARRLRATFDVTGSTPRDRLTRLASGPRVMLTVTCWAGNLILVESRFCRTTTYGMTCVTPTGPGRCRARAIIWVPRRRSSLGRAVLDPIDAAVRRSFIRAFLLDDQRRLAGVRITPASLLADGPDAVLADHYRWLAATVAGEPFPPSAEDPCAAC